MKHFHLLMVVITIALFLYSSYAIATKKAVSRLFFVISHIVYFLVIATGLHLLVMLSKVAGVQHWAYAKIVLLIVAISAIIKARKNPEKASAGLMIVWVAMFGIIGLAIIKPVL